MIDNNLNSVAKAVQIKSTIAWCFGISLLLTIAIAFLTGDYESASARESRTLPVKAVVVTLSEN
ncbi:hypothetical protein [Chroogloeocystis siderophila]|jgi:hypothetical protein|uniref:Uncharacterized protein n=1 Tax=Chroogloeocystis siderophila 5.2 s.c.1 TaxID=247279 RepID=A0A1U7HPC5_9CHRO|nr:hypothetical protein [Chroogloeocystis siderophila]OKH25394.1 hypothetical protein NIES1031_13540 [Chroogloeocystis siderophila 5.2 s.c.1]